jgi:hypothetical protein
LDKEKGFLKAIETCCPEGSVLTLKAAPTPRTLFFNLVSSRFSLLGPAWRVSAGCGMTSMAAAEESASCEESGPAGLSLSE